MEVEAPVERVFGAWFEPHEISRWLAPSANVSPERGGPYELYWNERDNTAGCHVLEVEPLRRVRIEWQGTGSFADLFQPPNERTFVDVVFDRQNDGRTLVTVEQSETRPIEGWAAYDETMAEAWEEALIRLKDVCETPAIAYA